MLTKSSEFARQGGNTKLKKGNILWNEGQKKAEKNSSKEIIESNCVSEIIVKKIF